MTQSTALTDAQLIHLARNALLVAGQEMGEKGDHWPVINSTIHQLMQDYQALQIERNLHAELKTHLYAKLSEMGRTVHTMPADKRQAVAQRLKELEEVSSAFFSEVDYSKMTIDAEDLPPHIKRLQHLIATLLEDEEGATKQGDGSSDAGGLLGSIVSGIVRLSAELRSRQAALQEFSWNFNTLLAKLDKQFGKVVNGLRDILSAAMPQSKSGEVTVAVRNDRGTTPNNHPRPGMG